MVELRNTCIILVRKFEGKRPLGRPRRRWVDVIKTDLQEVGCYDLEWILWFRIGTSGKLV